MTTTRVDCALPLALELVDAVHRMDRREVARLIDLADLPALAVVLAGMVDEDRTVRDLLGWVDAPLRPQRQPAARPGSPAQPAEAPAVPPRDVQLVPCGTHAAFARHKKRGEAPCLACVVGERTYQRERAQRRRAQQRTEAAA